MTNNTYHMEKLRSLLVNLPDLVRGLTRVQYGKATPSELATILTGLLRVASEFKANEGKVFKSELLNSILATLPTIADALKEFLAAIDMKAAKANNEADLWTDPDKYPDIQDAKDVSHSFDPADTSASRWARASSTSTSRRCAKQCAALRSTTLPSAESSTSWRSRCGTPRLSQQNG